MQLRAAYEYALIECNKLKAPTLLLEDYIYLFNKAIQQYVNSVYNRAEYNQQSSDDLGWLHTPVVLENGKHSEGFNGNVYTFELPSDYLHLLNCKAMISGNTTSSNKCGITTTHKSSVVNCSRLTSDLEGGIIDNYYNKPSHRKPYYYIINRSFNDEKFLDRQDPNLGYTTPHYKIENEDEIIEYSTGELKDRGSRVSNQSTLFIEIHLGDSDHVVDKVQLTYLRSPMYVSMTQEELFDEADNTQVLEFPDYVCYEIINIFTKLLLENSGDPRLTTNIPINQTIGSSN
jgi:hypothetical protein